MSNDTKFWTMRVVLFLGFCVNGWFLAKMLPNPFETAGDPGSFGLGGAGTSPVHQAGRLSVLWGVLFVISLFAMVPLVVYYRKAKAERFKDKQPLDQNQIDVQMLAAYAAQQAADKKKAAQAVQTQVQAPAQAKPEKPAAAPPTPPATAPAAPPADASSAGTPRSGSA